MTAAETARSFDAAPAGRKRRREFRVVLFGLMLVMALASMDSSIVNTALPRITAELGGVAHLSWVVTAFMLTATISTPLYGKLSDMYGRRLLLVVSISVFLLASVLCGAAGSMLQLILFLAFQGLGAGGLITLAQTIIGDLVPPRERGRYQGLFTGVFAISSVAGPLIGGALTTALSWRYVFYVNLPLGGLALATILTGLPRTAMTRRHAIDYGGAVLLAGATASLMLLLSFGLSEGSPILRGTLGALSVALAALFIVQEQRAAEPIISLRLFQSRTFTVGAGATAIMSFAMMGALVFLPLYLQLVKGQTPVAAGLIVTPQIGGMLLTSVLGGRAVSKVGRAKPFLVVGALVEAVSLFGLAAAAALGAPVWAFSAIVFALGLGMGLGLPNATTAVQNAVHPQDMGVATGALAFVRSLGGATGVALSGGVVSLVVSRMTRGGGGGRVQPLLGSEAASGAAGALHIGLQALHAYRWAIDASFLLSAVMMALAFALACTLPDDTLRGSETAP